MSGIIYKIERLAVYDGPGIRTVIFLKGCPLECLWCASPESQALAPEMGFRPERCRECGSCWNLCAQTTHADHSDHTDHAGLKAPSHPGFDHPSCKGCGDCALACPTGARAVIGRKVHVDRVMEELEKDSVFYHRSQGGVTLSGGEPTFQPDFAAEILRRSMEMGFHTAMETTAYTAPRSLERILGHLDLVYVDVKHMDDSVHRAVTGRGNERILENIRRIDTGFPGVELIIRVPLIPGINDSTENMEKTATFAASLRRLKRVELLPYHRYGVATYPVVGREYGLPDILPPTRAEVEKLKGILTMRGLEVRIGG